MADNLRIVTITSQDGKPASHYEIHLEKPFGRIFQHWTEKRNKDLSTNAIFEFRLNDAVLKASDSLEKLGISTDCIISAHETSNSPPSLALPHRWPLKIDRNMTHYQELVRQSTSDYVPPLMPFPIFDPSHLFPATFGPDMQQNNFVIDPNITYLNNGSFGATPQIVLQAQQRWQQYMESNCCRFFQMQFPAFLAHATRMLASFIGSQPSDVVFVDNATTGIIATLDSIPVKKGESILFLQIGYGPLINYYRHLSQNNGIELIEVLSPIPVDIEKLVIDVEMAVKPTTKIAILDHITSGTGLILPIEPLVKKLQEKGVFVIVDGAHSIGQIHLNMATINADAYVSNCHKWLYASKGCAFLWINPKHRNTIHPTVMSSGTGLGQHAEFGWCGTRDYTPYLSVMSAIEFYNHIGADKIRNYCHNMAVEQAEALVSKWGTYLAVKTDMKDPKWKQHIGNMVSIKLPVDSSFGTMDFADKLRNAMLFEAGIDMITYPMDGELYCRISTQIFLDNTDFSIFGEDVLKYLDHLTKENKNPPIQLEQSSFAQNHQTGQPMESH